MADLIAIGYPDERDKQELQEARYGQQAAAL
jgi:hypothetical protein